MRIGIATRLAVERDSQRLFFGTVEGEQWLDDALRMASLTCIPSVENLQVKPTFWFVLVDFTLRPALKKQIEQTFSRGTSVPVQLVLTNGWEDSSNALRSNPDANQCELQIRLDCDDMLHKSFLKTMAEVSLSLHEACCLISPSNGICRELEPSQFAQIHKELPPFLALYRRGKFSELSIFSFDHDKWPDKLVHELITSPLWIQTVTGNNITNRFGRGWKVQSLRHLRNLNLEPWTGVSEELLTSTSWVGLRNCIEHVRERVNAKSSALAK
ncbi:hypothetical protein N9D95_02515 [Flavobacteriales bacterium]|nr:hypothetical protein [Flavobacteriales bacterium]